MDDIKFEIPSSHFEDVGLDFSTHVASPSENHIRFGRAWNGEALHSL